jgi:hypothetical protein
MFKSRFEIRMMQLHLSDKRLALILQVTFPTPIVQPAEISIYPNSYTKWVAQGMVLLTDMRPVKISDLAITIKSN